MSGEAASSSSGVVLQGLDDVEEFIWANEGEGSLPWDRFSHVFDLVQNGNKAFRENHFEEAINYYSRANNIKPGDPIILGNRSAAYSRVSHFLKQRPASTSEDTPLNGLDPTIHAELALKDAEKVINLRNNSVNPYILKANALILLEKYELAQDVVLSGLQVDPFRYYVFYFHHPFFLFFFWFSYHSWFSQIGYRALIFFINSQKVVEMLSKEFD